MWVDWNMEVAVFNRVVWMGHVEKVTLELRPEGCEDVNYVPF